MGALGFFSSQAWIHYNTKVGDSTVVNSQYNVIGSSISVPSLLSTAYSGNTKTLLVDGLQSLHLDVFFTPTTTNEYALVKIEQSNDNGATYFPLSTKTVGTTEIGLNVANATDGVPTIFPSTKVTTASTSYYGSIDFNVIGQFVRISAKSVSTTGAIYIHATGSSK